MQTIINTDKVPLKNIPKSVQGPMRFSWIIFLVILAASIIYYFISQPELPILYSVANKEDQLMEKIYLFVFPISSFVINFIHLIILNMLKKYSSILLKLFVGTTLALQLLLAFAFLRIIIITI